MRLDNKDLLGYFFERRKKIFGVAIGLLLGFIWVFKGFGSLIVLALSLFVGYNYEDILKKIKDIIKQLPNNIELVIGHNDKNTFYDFLLKSISKKSNIVLVSTSIKSELTNNSTLRNIAVEKASSDVIFLMDVDIWFDIKLYKDCANLVRTEEKPFVMLPCIYLTDKGSKTIEKLQREKMFEKLISFRRDLFQHIASPSSVIFLKKTDYSKIGGFDEKFVGHGYEDFDFIVRGDGFCEMTVKGFSKGTGIEKVLEYHNIPIDNAYAIGDSMNDLPMLTAVPNSIVMGNGSEELKKSASFVTKDLLDNGIEYALKHFGMI